MSKKPFTPRVGRYVGITSMARVDCIGQVVRANENGSVVVRVPNWTADGQPRDFNCWARELEPATKADATAAAAAR